MLQGVWHPVVPCAAAVRTAPGQLDCGRDCDSSAAAATGGGVSNMHQQRLCTCSHQGAAVYPSVAPLPSHRVPTSAGMIVTGVCQAVDAMLQQHTCTPATVHTIVTLAVESIAGGQHCAGAT